MIVATSGITGILCGMIIYNHRVTKFDRPLFLSDKKETILATYVYWMCNCANFVDTLKYETDPVTEPKENDYFFIEPDRPELKLNRDHFMENSFVKLTGHFYIDKGIPTDFKIGWIEDKPDHARVFKFEKIEYLKNAN
jgi:hypothetical protein